MKKMDHERFSQLMEFAADASKAWLSELADEARRARAREAQLAAAASVAEVAIDMALDAAAVAMGPAMRKQCAEARMELLAALEAKP